MSDETRPVNIRMRHFILARPKTSYAPVGYIFLTTLDDDTEDLLFCDGRELSKDKHSESAHLPAGRASPATKDTLVKLTFAC